MKVGYNSDGTLNPVCDTVTPDQVDAGLILELHCGIRGRYLSIEVPSERLHFCEIEVYEGDCLRQGKEDLA